MHAHGPLAQEPSKQRYGVVLVASHVVRRNPSEHSATEFAHFPDVQSTGAETGQSVETGHAPSKAHEPSRHLIFAPKHGAVPKHSPLALAHVLSPHRISPSEQATITGQESVGFVEREKAENFLHEPSPQRIGDRIVHPAAVPHSRMLVVQLRSAHLLLAKQVVTPSQAEADALHLPSAQRKGVARGQLLTGSTQFEEAATHSPFWQRNGVAVGQPFAGCT